MGETNGGIPIHFLGTQMRFIQSVVLLDKDSG